MSDARSRRRTGAIALILLAVLALLAGCAGLAGPNNVATVDTNHLSGFWSGLWQGLILPIAFVISLFTDSVSIYDVHNNGNWYDFGFVLGVMILPAGGGRAGRGGRR